MTIYGLKLKRGTYAGLKASSQVLRVGEPVYLTDINRLVVGDGTTQGWKLPKILTDDQEGFIQRLNNTYAGKLLTANPVNEAEIEGYTTIWDWLAARNTAGNYENINLRDRVQFDISAGTITDSSATAYEGTYSHTVSAQTMTAEIVGINNYKGYGDGGHVVGNHIDFRCTAKVNVSPNVIWQRSNNNNGTSENQNPYMASVIKAFLNGENNYSTNAYNSVAHGADFSAGGLLQLLPSALVNVLKTKRLYVGTRYNASQLLTQDTAGAWVDLGKLWLFHEKEIFGAPVHSASADSSGMDRSNMGIYTYPVLQEMSVTDKTCNRVASWLASVPSGSSSRACYLHGNGYAGAPDCTNPDISVVFGFRIAS